MMIYSCIAKDKKSVLCEYTEYNGNFQQVSTRVLEKVIIEDDFFLEYDG